jgi:uncharacterized protein YjbI with pentapeptide repeats
MNELTQRIISDLSRIDRDQIKSTLHSFIASGNADFTNATFQNVMMRAVDFTGLDLTNSRFLDCDCSGVTFSRCTLHNAALISGRADNCKFDGASLVNSSFDISLQGSDFAGADLTGVRFDGCDLRGARFQRAILQNASLLNIRVDESTTFRQVETVRNAKIERYTLACLKDESGLTLGNKMDLRIVDDVAKLRSEFGGIWAIVHVLALVVFVFPYAKFLLTQSALANFSRDAPTDITLLEAFGRFVYSGGENWKGGWNLSLTSFLAFTIYLVYNAARSLLLWKTKSLETQQEVSGLPAKFSLTKPSNIGRRNVLRLLAFAVNLYDFVLAYIKLGIEKAGLWSFSERIVIPKWPKWRDPINGWYICYVMVHIIFWLAAVSVIVNTIHFMMQRVPTT